MDLFQIRIEGVGTHAATPELGVDPILVASHVVVALQGIISREINPIEGAVITITDITAGTGALNTIPSHAVMNGTARVLSPAVRNTIEERLHRVVTGVANAHRAAADLSYRPNYPPTVTDPVHTEIAVSVAEEVAGSGKVDANYAPNMASEDFSFMLQKKPGAYIFIGNGPEENGRILHNPRYDFNDEILPIGSSYWARLVETVLR
jgi:hippurate hydrolase